MFSYIVIGILLVVAVGLVYYQPSWFWSWPSKEGFTSAAVDPERMPACTTRSVDAQALLEQIAGNTSDAARGADAANELRLLVSKLCCMEADIASPSPGTYRTFGLQFRTQQDLEPPATIVGRCLAGAVSSRDTELIVEKYKQRGHLLIQRLSLDTSATNHFDVVVGNLEKALKSKCKSPTMDHPSGVRDVGFWEPDSISDLSQYQGVSAAPKDS